MLSEQFQPLRRKLDALPERDRFALTALAVFVGIALIYFLVWTPVVKWVNQAELRYQNKQALIHWIEQNRPALMAAQGNQSNGAVAARKGRSVLSIVNDAARNQTLAIKRVEPKNAHELRVWMESVDFNAVLKWLHILDERYGIRATTVSLDKDKKPGLVTATIILSG